MDIIPSKWNVGSSSQSGVQRWLMLQTYWKDDTGEMVLVVVVVYFFLNFFFCKTGTFTTVVNW